MKRVMATGVFDIIHPGHLHFLNESKKLGDELVVVVARDSTARRNGKEPVFDEMSRLKIVSALKCVDRAILGHEGDIYKTVSDVSPDVITLGFNQKFDPDTIRKRSLEKGVRVEVVRISKFENSSMLSSSQVRSKILQYIGEDI
ncbi:MAG: adenylyltransferase/cytidyltransferase family protein [Candidatus Thermoplasmatota archaeon]|nr:adenylyltransferase/cytidyltransferase family protein [Candidatus Thermoplasmatota archaeon]